jgi:hypothetical protein
VPRTYPEQALKVRGTYPEWHLPRFISCQQDIVACNVEIVLFPQSTKLINVIRDAPGTRFWQRNYYEHIIRDGHDLDRICKYITENVFR